MTDSHDRPRTSADSLGATPQRRRRPSRTAYLASGIVCLLLSLVWFAGRFTLLPEAWMAGGTGLLLWGLAWAFLLGGVVLVARALWPGRREPEAPTEDELFDSDGRP